MAPESVSIVTRAPPEPVVKLSSRLRRPLARLLGRGPELVRDRAAEARHREVGRRRRRRAAAPPAPLTVSIESVARAASAASKRTLPETDSSSARSYEPPSTCSLPFTVEASSSPEVSRSTTLPFTGLGLDPARAPSSRRRSPLTLCSSTCFAAPGCVIEPLTVSAFTEPVTPLDADRGLEALDVDRAAGGHEDLEVALDRPSGCGRPRSRCGCACRRPRSSARRPRPPCPSPAPRPCPSR